MKLPDGYVNGIPPRKATAMGGFGQQMLERMGWQKGRGLGKESQGIVAPVEASQKDDTVGLGGKRTWDWEHDYAASAYETAMAKLQANDATATSSSSSDSDSDDDVATDDSVRSTSLQFAGIVSSASAAELKLAKQLAKGNNLGRFGSRSGKLERIREQEAVLAAQVDHPKTCHQQSADVGTACGSSRKQAKTIVIESKEEAIERPPPIVQPSSWWGHKAFVSSGWLGGLHEPDQPSERQAFTASTQEEVYNRVKEKQRQGKAGMGKRKGKDAAADWKGTKMVFDDADERGGTVCGGLPPPPDEQPHKSPGRSQKPKALKIAKGLIRSSKRARVKRSRLHTALMEALSCSDRKAEKKLKQFVDAGRLCVSDKWVMLAD
eukprot:jgi/Ulvmu1/458/UM001_0465.1